MRGIGLVTGDSGSGKTTTCRRLVAGLHTGLYRVLYVSMTTGNVMDLYKSIAWELGLPTERNRAALFKQIRGEVSRLCAENKDAGWVCWRGCVAGVPCVSNTHSKAKPVTMQRQRWDAETTSPGPAAATSECSRYPAGTSAFLIALAEGA